VRRCATVCGAAQACRWLGIAYRYPGGSARTRANVPSSPPHVGTPNRAEKEIKKLCFVVGPIGAEDNLDRIHADWVLEIIRPVIAGFPDFETKRADQITKPGMIDAQIINALLTADLVIADLSTLNPNAFYEIGIRHMIPLDRQKGTSVARSSDQSSKRLIVFTKGNGAVISQYMDQIKLISGIKNVHFAESK
jgi:hypothetical protein